MSIVKLVLTGDVMLGRGIDQILPDPCSPELFEEYIARATDYVALAERAHGPIAKPVGLAYVWGDSLAEMERVGPQLRIVNLETSVTRRDEPWPKGINYRVSPENASCLGTAKIDCCVLANNHILDWGWRGLADTLGALYRLQIKTAGAGSSFDAASAPAVFDCGGSARVVVFACATADSGVPASWAAQDRAAGVHLLADLSEQTIDALADHIGGATRAGDIVVLSIHWGPNWGYGVSPAQRRFAHALVERASVAIVHGHSSHHPKALEVHRDRLILYGCGDFVNDYEGLKGREEFRGDLSLMYVASVDVATGALAELEMVPFRMRRFQLSRAEQADVEWLHAALARESAKFGTAVELESGRLFAHRGRT